MNYSFALAVLLAAGPAFSDQITPDAFAALPPADVVILGETHDNPTQHAHQARAVEVLAPSALVFEMLTPEQAAKVTQDLRRDAEALAEVLDWDSSGWPDFEMYAPIFAASTAPVYGAALPRDEVRRAFSEGAAEVFGAEADRYGLTTPLPEEMQEDRAQMQFEAHCEAMPLEMMTGMVEAQRLRDAAFSRVALQALEDTGGPVVVIAGNGHARSDWGMPAVLAEAAPDVTVLSVGQLETPLDETPPYDVWLVTEAAERGDPCAGFAKAASD